MQEEYRSVLKLDTSGFLGPLKRAGAAMRETMQDISRSAAKESARAQQETAQAGTNAARVVAQAQKETAQASLNAAKEVAQAQKETARAGADAAKEAAHAQQETAQAGESAVQEAQQSAQKAKGIFASLREMPGLLMQGVKGFLSGFAGGAVEEFRLMKTEAAQASDSAAGSAEKSAQRVSGGVLPKLKTAFSGLFRGVRGALSGAGSFFGGLFKGGLQGLKEALPGVRKHLQGVNGEARTGALSFLRYAVGMRAVSALAGHFRSFTVEGMRNLVQFSASANSAVSSIMSALTQLKNSFATAFAPITEVMAPYITSFIKMIAEALSAVSAFISALTGKSTYTRAVAVQQDYAASLQSTTSGAKDAANATKEQAEAQKELNRQLMGFDQINKLNDNSSGSSDSGGSGGSGAGAGSAALSPAMMFTTEEIPGIIGNWADMFKKAWEDADFSGIGATVGAKLRDALDKIPWDGIKEKCNKVATSLATFLNGFVETPKLWTSIGNTIGQGLNTAFETADTFLETFHFESLGAGLAEAINSAVDVIDAPLIGRTIAAKLNAAIDTLHGLVTNLKWGDIAGKISSGVNSLFEHLEWEKAGETLSEGAKGVFTTLSKTIQGIDWRKLGEDVKTFLTSIDWGGVASSVFSAIGSAFGGFAAFLSGLFKGALDNFYAKYIEPYMSIVEEAGGDIFTGILAGILAAVIDLGKWIKTNIFDPFVNGFKAAFGIHSPAKEMEEPGKMVGEGILNGIAAPFKAAAKWVQEHVLKPIGDALSGKSVKFSVDVANDAAAWWSNVQKWWKDKVGAVEKFTTGVANAAGDWWGNVQKWWKGKVGAVEKFTTGVANDAGSWWSNVKSWWKGKVGKLSVGVSIINSAKDWWKNVTGWWKKAAGTLATKLKISLPKIVIETKTKTFLGKDFTYPTGFKVKWNAKGGILDGATIFGMAGNTLLGGGEAGREAVLPLDSNTSWMDRLADKVASRVASDSGGSNQPIRVQVVLDGRVVAESTVREWQRQARLGRYPLSGIV